VNDVNVKNWKAGNILGNCHRLRWTHLKNLIKIKVKIFFYKLEKHCMQKSMLS